MKRTIFLCLMLMALATGVFAQRDGRAILKLRLSDRSIIAVSLDGRFIDQQTSALTLDGVRPGLHRLEVYADAGARRRPVRVYTGTLRLQPATVHVGVVDIYNRGLHLRTRPMDNRDYAVAQPADGGRDRNNGYQRDERGQNPNERDYDTQRDDDVYSQDGRTDNGGRSSSGSGGEGYGSFPRGRSERSEASGAGISQRDMDELRSRVSARITDSDKEQLLRTFLQSRNPSTEQVRQMLGWLSFDSTRLSFAKWAYERVADRRNYWKLEDVFSFDSSREEFSKFISGR